MDLKNVRLKTNDKIILKLLVDNDFNWWITPLNVGLYIHSKYGKI